MDGNRRDKMEIMSDYELQLLISQVEEQGMLRAPKRLKENILEESHSLEMRVSVQAKQISAKAQLWMYGLKIAAAIVGAVFLLNVVNMESFSTLGERKAALETEMEQSAGQGTEKADKKEETLTRMLNEKSNRISSALNDFSNSIVK